MGDPIHILRLFSANLSEITQDPVRLATVMCSEGVISSHAKDDLLTTDGQSRGDKSRLLWNQIEYHIKCHTNPRQALINVCNIIKHRKELEALADAMKSQLMPNSENSFLKIHNYNVPVYRPIAYPDISV